MRETLRRLVLSYLTDVNNRPDAVPDDELLWMADKFVNDVARALSARNDFKEDAK